MSDINLFGFELAQMLGYRQNGAQPPQIGRKEKQGKAVTEAEVMKFEVAGIKLGQICHADIQQQQANGNNQPGSKTTE